MLQVSPNMLLLGVGLLLGVFIEKQARRHRRRLPPPSQCPAEGVEFKGCLDIAERPCRWVFFSNHLLNLAFYNEHAATGGSDFTFTDPRHHIQISYPVRLRACAGFMRCFGLKDGAIDAIRNASFTDGGLVAGRKAIGDQTIISTVRVDDPERAHDIVGVLVPFPEGKTAKPPQEGKVTKYVQVPMSSFDWLGAFDPPPLCEMVDVLVFADEAHLSPPTFDYPILQTHLDVLLEGALKHGEDFAKELLDTIMWWESEEDVCYYLNDRSSARRPWVKNIKAPQIDKLLQEHPRAVGGGNIIDKHRAHVSGYDRKHNSKLLPALKARDIKEEGGSLPPPAKPSITGISLERARLRAEQNEGIEFKPPPPLAQRPKVTNFVLGFGSIIQTASRAGSGGALDAAPCRIKAAFGYVREWNFQASTAQICALGLRKVRDLAGVHSLTHSAHRNVMPL